MIRDVVKSSVMVLLLISIHVGCVETALAHMANSQGKNLVMT